MKFTSFGVPVEGPRFSVQGGTHLIVHGWLDHTTPYLGRWLVETGGGRYCVQGIGLQSHSQIVAKLAAELPSRTVNLCTLSSQIILPISAFKENWLAPSWSGESSN